MNNGALLIFFILVPHHNLFVWFMFEFQLQISLMLSSLLNAQVVMEVLQQAAQLDDLQLLVHCKRYVVKQYENVVQLHCGGGCGGGGGGGVDGKELLVYVLLLGEEEEGGIR